MEPAAFLTILGVIVIVAILVIYLFAIIGQLTKINNDLNIVIAGVLEIVRKSAPVNGVVTTINGQLDAGVDLLEGLLVKKAGMRDALGLVEGLYPGSAAAGFRRFGQSGRTQVPRIGEVYTRGTLTLARLGREAPIAAGNPAGAAMRNAVGASSASRTLYPDPRRSSGASRDNLPKSPVVGGASPNQYEPSLSPGERTRRPESQNPSPQETGFSIQPPRERAAEPAPAYTPPSRPEPASAAPAPAPVSAEVGPAPAPEVADEPAYTPPPEPARFSAISKRPWET